MKHREAVMWGVIVGMLVMFLLVAFLKPNQDDAPSDPQPSYTSST